MIEIKKPYADSTVRKKVPKWAVLAVIIAIAEVEKENKSRALWDVGSIFVIENREELESFRNGELLTALKGKGLNNGRGCNIDERGACRGDIWTNIDEWMVPIFHESLLEPGEGLLPDVETVIETVDSLEPDCSNGGIFSVTPPDLENQKVINTLQDDPALGIGSSFTGVAPGENFNQEKDGHPHLAKGVRLFSSEGDLMVVEFWEIDKIVTLGKFPAKGDVIVPKGPDGKSDKDYRTTDLKTTGQWICGGKPGEGLKQTVLQSRKWVFTEMAHDMSLPLGTVCTERLWSTLQKKAKALETRNIDPSQKWGYILVARERLRPAREGEEIRFHHKKVTYHRTELGRGGTEWMKNKEEVHV
jgi:hypothetical protein